jgi:Holliday junction resolvase RusA-like endonuclease
MSEPVSFVVRGLPVAQGNARAFIAKGKGGAPDRAIYATSAAKGFGGKTSPLQSWRNSLAAGARETMGTRSLLDGPLCVRVVFVFPRPASHYLPANSKRPVRHLRGDAPVYHASKPDVDKLQRALLDALKLVVWHDDSQVADVRARKVYELSRVEGLSGEWDWQPGAVVEVDGAR